MTSKIAAWGNSLAIRLPKSFLDELDLEEGSPVNISMENGKILVSGSKQVSLKDLVAKITPENRHDEFWADMKPVGKEIW